MINVKEKLMWIRMFIIFGIVLDLERSNWGLCLILFYYAYVILGKVFLVCLSFGFLVLGFL